ncbi:hypothetical protein [Leisingera methylohalidivorans]|uniref:Uncharacterized protein n=1 Tax=Leisingera methylohalidivorans DSM 14336 TaxID=999552 RepID=V9VUJ0_9RHOB|nr:hypothetical protein [Leisingera methylohalidivorans]AHD01688.1 hypothetical protein METH_14145 [Leisingera methylohalidivorans DSM 14336]
MMGRRGFLALAAAVSALGLAAVAARSRGVLVPPPLAPPEAALKVFHLGHSLVGPDMPHMLAQLAPAGHGYNSQLGSGTSLRAHWEPGEDILDFAAANQPPAYRDARQAVGSGEYDAVVLTEMVELRDALRYFDAAEYLGKWAGLAREASPDTRIYLYETWHRLNDPEGWLDRIDGDLENLWVNKLLGPDSRGKPQQPVYLIPGGQVLAALARAAEAGGIPGLASRESLFARTSEGGLDTIHVNDLGAYAVALTHYAVLYQRAPAGLRHELTRADGSPAQAFSAEAAAKVQQIVWDAVRALPRTGLGAAGGPA